MYEKSLLILNNNNLMESLSSSYKSLDTDDVVTLVSGIVCLVKGLGSRPSI